MATAAKKAAAAAAQAQQLQRRSSTSMEHSSSLLEEIRKINAKMESMQTNLQQEIKSLRTDLKQDFKSEVKKISQSLEEVKKDVNQAKSKIKDLEVKSKKLEEATTKLDLQHERDLDQKALEDQKHRENCLKIRGLKELKNEDLYDYVVTTLADYMEIPKMEYLWEINKTFRVNSTFAREQNISRDTVVYFVRKKARDDVLFQSYQKDLIIEGKQVKIYKDVPKRILRKREDYKFLTTQLSKKKIFYKWEKLEGLSVNFKQKWYKLNTIQKAKDFWKKNGQEIQNTFVRRNKTYPQNSTIKGTVQTRSQKKKEEAQAQTQAERKDSLNRDEEDEDLDENQEEEGELGSDRRSSLDSTGKVEEGEKEEEEEEEGEGEEEIDDI
ncbi:neurofilament medium polypeptide-like [Sceloporus undulatus]|uniref:neurofilament medium polypeptide-like n=1 Tax=Sceloporus undulatus TaxID=8520 RepID=UPI001C4B4BD8|nr:neurofilament medium polypeptide-like [Sceloporus undulatus]XP_042304129.1 neurofilament medium polypeptide-like [Sceloporus undulatus]